ncbi:MAG TPA: FAD-dependent oxidoreductase [Allosphingosinicella sp.]|jgi:glycine/D-amino acid oxidase-like deaminating enzyme
MDRRAFLGSAASALALPGCATTSGRIAAAPTGCLPPVRVDQSRIIRTVAGLRPYRTAGFVVRAEPLGDKRLVHNYGHGGAGITLSWGSSRLAAELGLRGHQGPVAVIGAGVMGLTTARLVQEAGFPVSIYAEALTPHTTSNIAGGQISPYGHFEEDSVTPEWRAQFAAAMDYSWRRFQILVGDDYGIRWLPTYQQTASGGPRPAHPFRPGIRRLSPAEHPFAVEHMILYNTMYVETGRFLRQLTRDVQIAGGRIAVRRFATPADIAALPETLVFNCTGLGARDLFGDKDLHPVRGQLAILLPQPEIRYAVQAQGGYMFPRADGILLGGTFERDEWEAAPQPEAIASIVASHKAMFEGFRCASAA